MIDRASITNWSVAHPWGQKSFVEQDLVISLQEQRNFWPEYLLPILLVGKDVDGKHRTQSQEEGDIDITCDISATREYWYQADEVTCQNKEEHRKQIRRIRLVMLLTNRRLNQIVVDHHYNHLHSSDETSRCLVLHVVCLIPAGT